MKAGFEQRDSGKIREKYRKLKTKYHDVKLHNLKATGRDRKIWHLYDLADSVWGHRPVAAKKTIDTDKDETEVFDGDVNCNDDEDDDVQPSKAKKSKKDSKMVVKFGRGTGGKRDANVSSDNYLVDKLVELEEKRMDNEMKLQRERLEAERATREAQMQFQRDMMNMMVQMQQTHSHSTQFSPVHASQRFYEPQFTPERGGQRAFKEPTDHPEFARSLYDFHE